MKLSLPKISIHKALIVGVIGLVLYVPFHGFVSTALIHQFGFDQFFKVWKDGVLAILLGLALYEAYKTKGLLWELCGRRINQLILFFIFLHFFLFGLFTPDLDAAVAGLIINGRYFAIFIIGQILAARVPLKNFLPRLEKWMLWGVLAISVVALLQISIIPTSFMETLGYSDQTIPSEFYIDGNTDFERAYSASRGPNQLGLLLILPLLFLSAVLVKRSTPKLHAIHLLAIGALWFSYSRSAWLAMILATLSFSLLNIEKVWAQRRLVVQSAVVIALCVLVLFTVKDVATTRILVLHDDPDRAGRHSTELRLEANEIGINALGENIWGDGPGTAGPASFHNDDIQRVSDNTFIQIGLELGLAGLLAYIAIHYQLAKHLWLQRGKMLNRVLLATFVGLTVANFFVHAWDNEEVALAFWAFAGFSYSSS